MAIEDYERSKSTIGLSRIVKLESPTEWKKWHAGIQEWAVDQDLNVAGPVKPADLDMAANPPPDDTAVTAHAIRVQTYEQKKTAYLRKHLKAANSLKSTCDDRGKDIIDSQPAGTLFQQCVDALAEEFNPTAEAYLTNIEREWDDLPLAGCKDVDEYTRKFNNLRAELKALKNELPQHTLTSKFIGGLGQGFNQWHQNLEINRNISGPWPHAQSRCGSECR